MQESGVAVAESRAVCLPAWAWDRRVAPAWVVGEDRRLAGFDVAAGCFKAVVVSLLLHGLEVDDGRRRSIDRLGMGTSGKESGGKCCNDAKGLLHVGLRPRRAGRDARLATAFFLRIRGFRIAPFLPVQTRRA